jgi:hypothetical protein
MANASSFLNFVGAGKSDATPGTTNARPPSGGSSAAQAPSRSFAGGSSVTRQQTQPSNLAQFLGGGAPAAPPKPSGGGGSYYRSGGDAVQRRKLAKEAYARIRRFMDDNHVVFDGAGETEKLPSIEQAWSVRHSNPSRARANEDTLKGIAGSALASRAPPSAWRRVARRLHARSAKRSAG